MIASLVLAAAQAMTFTADRIAADNVTRALVATGHLVAASGPVTIRGELMTRDPDGRMFFHDPVCATTCTNEVGHTHWNVSGEIEYKEKDYVILRNMWLSFYEMPILWLPYMYYPLETDCGFSWMPGYTGRWGAYLLTRYRYHLLGDPSGDETAWWLKGGTRFDLRYVQGLALGEDLEWNLGDFGSGKFNIYYAWDRDADGNDVSWHNYNWGSEIDRDRYTVGFSHRWELTERDTVSLRASVYSDSYFRDDFERSTLFGWQNSFISYQNSGLFWEHVENDWAFGAEMSGRLNKFYGMTGRLPEIYLDLNPQPIFGLPVNYETANRLGYLTRDPAECGTGGTYENPFSFNPGAWADYEAFRFDTYHRLTAPFKTFDDVLSVVPRIGYHGTLWSATGEENLSGWGDADSAGSLFRSILEGGMTFAGRGAAWVNEDWRHTVEPYFDVLAQKAWFGGSGNRPYVFDGIDASLAWEDQFAGRSRNLPYTYYGVTPGLRNAWEKMDARGNLRQVVDFDVYAALQFGETSFAGDDDAHKLAEVGLPNYGKGECYVAPGARVRWTPDEDISLLARAEYDSDNNTVATADAGWQHVLSKSFKYNVKYALRDYRCWDFSSTPYDRTRMSSDDLNYAKMHFVHVGFENQPLDWFAWSPFVRWDIRENELDGIGSWFDYLTDCLGFRFLVEYRNSYQRIDGYERKEDWSFGFYIYLRAFGPESSNVFGN